MGYKVGDMVVYPRHGAAKVEAITERTVKGVTREYLQLSVLSSDGAGHQCSGGERQESGCPRHRRRQGGREGLRDSAYSDHRKGNELVPPVQAER